MSFPAEQERIRDTCHPRDGVFIPFPQADTECSAVRRFETQVIQSPDKLAVSSESGRATYAELNRRANRLARTLLATPTDSLQVGLLFEDGIAMITAMLATLKAGRLFVALDPAYPRERIDYMVSDSRIGCLLTESRHAALAQSLAPAGGHMIDAEHIPEGTDEVNLDLEIPPDTLAYLIYTSGSTGHPKGVTHSHRTLLQNIRGYTNLSRIGPGDRLSVLHSFAFSTAITETFLALLNGASSHPWNLRVRGFNGLADWIDAEGITSICWIPTPLRQFAATLDPRRAPMRGVRLVMLGSEPVTVRDAEACRRLFGNMCVFVNRLGATETGNFRAYFGTGPLSDAGARIPAGYAVSHTEVLLLDEAGNPLPEPGQVGVIAIHTPSLSPGYWEKADLTARTFIRDPRGGERRFYLTGDLGRLSSDGCLEFLGRSDSQVKIRGFRIELSEIETRLLADSRLKDAIVLAREDERGVTRLVAYAVAASTPAPTAAELRAFLADKLPDHMIPWDYVFLERMPTTPTGKVDRRALPSPLSVASAPAKVVALTETETKLAAIWSRALRREHIGPDDHFFQTGGDSLAAAAAFVEMEAVFGRRLPLSTLVAAPTIRSMAALLERVDDGGASWGELVPIQPRGSKPPLFFVHAHMGNVIGYYHLATHLGEDRPFLAFQARGLDGKSPPSDDFTEMAERYVRLMRAVQPRGPYHIGGFCFGGSLAVEMARRLVASGETVGLAITIQGRSHDYPRYQAGLRGAVRPLLRALRRLQIESQSLREQSLRHWPGHLVGRWRRLKTLASAALAKLWPGDGGPTFVREAAQQIAYERTHIRAFRAHRFEPSPADLLVIRAANQPFGIAPDASLGWRGLTRGQLHLATIPGNEAGILSEPRVRLVASVIREHLEGADAQRSA